MKKYCLCMRSGIKLWLDEKMAEKVRESLLSGSGKFLVIGDRVVNTADLSGLFTDREVSSSFAGEVIDGNGTAKSLNEPVNPKDYNPEEYKKLLEKRGYKVEI